MRPVPPAWQVVGGISHLSKNRNMGDWSQAAQEDACTSPACSGQEVTPRSSTLQTDLRCLVGTTTFTISSRWRHLGRLTPDRRSRSMARITGTGGVWTWSWCESDHEEVWAQKNWCSWIVVLEKTLRVPWTAKRWNNSILKELDWNNPEYSLEGLMLKLKL